MSAADLLRALIAEAPTGLHVARDGRGDRALFDGDDDLLIWIDQQFALALIGPLLAAAPHIADLLDDLDTNADPTAAARRALHAIEEASQ